MFYHQSGIWNKWSEFSGGWIGAFSGTKSFLRAAIVVLLILGVGGRRRLPSDSSSHLTILNHLVHQQAQSFCHPWLVEVKVIFIFDQLYPTAFWVQQNCQSCSFCKECKQLQTAGSASHPLTSWHTSHFQEAVPILFSLPKNYPDAYLGTSRPDMQLPLSCRAEVILMIVFMLMELIGN